MFPVLVVWVVSRDLSHGLRMMEMQQATGSCLGFEGNHLNEEIDRRLVKVGP